MGRLGVGLGGGHRRQTFSGRRRMRDVVFAGRRRASGHGKREREEAGRVNGGGRRSERENWAAKRSRWSPVRVNGGGRWPVRPREMAGVHRERCEGAAIEQRERGGTGGGGDFRQPWVVSRRRRRLLLCVVCLCGTESEMEDRELELGSE